MPSIAGNKPIIVTGANRSGTTWIGRILSLPRNVHYVHEPFNSYYKPNHRGPVPCPLVRQFHYVTDTEKPEVMNYVLSRIKHHDNTGNRSPDDLPRRSALQSFFHSPMSATEVFRPSRPLIKDPTALMSAQWLAEALDAEVVIVIRHPAGYVSSIRRMGWRYDLNNLLEQPDLTHAYLGPLEEAIRHHITHHESDALGEAILFWKVCCRVASLLRQKHPHWQIVRHEDLSRDPVDAFRNLYDSLSLPYNTDIQAHIQRCTSADHPVEADPGRTHHLNRNSRRNMTIWKQRLSDDDILRIRNESRDIADAFYSDDDW